MSLKERSLRMRRNVLASIYEAGSGHPGGALSCVDLINFICCENYSKLSNSRFVLSKGHAAPALYAAAVENKWIEFKSLSKLRKINSPLQGHPSVIQTPWVEASTGSLGQGFSVSIGMSMGFKHQKIDTLVYTLLGDGELQEGEIWEGAMCAAHHQLDNLCAIIDYNKLQSDDKNENIMKIEPLKNKLESFNWKVIEIDGHDFDQIKKALDESFNNKEKPLAIIANTIKGKGVSYMENIPSWHGSVKIRPDEFKIALRELQTSEEKIESFLNSKIWSEINE